MYEKYNPASEYEVIVLPSYDITDFYLSPIVTNEGGTSLFKLLNLQTLQPVTNFHPLSVETCGYLLRRIYPSE